MVRNDSTNVRLEVTGLKKHFPIRRGVFKRVVGHVPAVDGVSFTVRDGETLGLVGESGCGKTTAIRTIMRVYEPTAGAVRFRMEDDLVDIAGLRSNQLRSVWKHVRMVFQDPDSSLNPRIPVREIIAEPLVMYKVATRKKEVDEHVRRLMEIVGLNPAHLRRYPHAFSGGQRQRIGIARALALNPKLILADEPTSALDVSVQAQILNLLLEIQRDMGLSYIFVTHDLGVVRHVSDRLAVMYLGQIAEIGRTMEVFHDPLHPYTKALLSAIPVPDPHRPSRRVRLKGEIPDPANRPRGCPFHPRCSYREAVCGKVAPRLCPIPRSDRMTSCHIVMKRLTGSYCDDGDSASPQSN